MGGIRVFRATHPRIESFSTVFSTGVEILVSKPKPPCGPRTSQIPNSNTQFPTSNSQRAWGVGSWDLGVGWTSIEISAARHTRDHWRRQDQHERQAYLSAQHPAPQEDARLPGQDGDQERSNRPQTTSGEGSQAADGCRRRIIGSAAGPSSNASTRREPKRTVGS
jgi:hypothetical protein